MAGFVVVVVGGVVCGWGGLGVEYRNRMGDARNWEERNIAVVEV